MSDLKFGCTLCGRCCKNLSLPLTLDEAIAWLEDDGQVAIFCEAYPFQPPEPGQIDLRAEHRRKRSFAVRCGSSQARVTAIFVAVISGACRHLSEDLKCNIYDRRPLVCRIYPAEISPFVQFDTAAKACPPEAWLAGEPLVTRRVQRLAEESRQTDRDDVPQKSVICSELKMSVAAVADEGYAAYYPEGGLLLDVIKRARATNTASSGNGGQWRIHSPREKTITALQASGLEVISAKGPADAYSFLYAGGQ
jgi:Fe-S-cluster containining protein